ncbi:ABC-type antimicrobial peptide transport system, permease component [Salinarchaeum sp. Harcht-Bsk1]|uniref:ABC transporter permease n=1 Tax=Salinarchaeum sp. Harcht-Bsk1 TaxID=1333523 RepID=UPI00034237A5|nr:ABC transporter permease [Salinarchaeum sp. Harcht-Bsk1]AGN00152.1 ABC-type antimicrobial peptide transport system, permease component [Salinarchaeum sp. Harcht-Bsk1]
MKIGESFRISWRAITGHKLRSTLTTIGIVIGIGSIIAFMVLGGAFEEDAIGGFDTEEQTLVLVQTQGNVENGFGFQTFQDPIYTASDVEQIEQIDGVEFVDPDGTIPASQLRYGDESTVSFTVRIADPRSFSKNVSGSFVEGEPFAGPGETVIDTRLAESLGGNVSVGDEIQVSFSDGTRERFTVSGIFNAENQGPGIGASLWVAEDPYYNVTVETPSGERERAYTSLNIWVESFDDINDVTEQTDAYFHSGDSDAEQLVDDDKRIAVQTLDQLLGQVAEIFDQVTIFIAGIAGIALIVGAIGIANIMIVSVTERTREIGIMKAVGANNRDIVQLFLIESLILGIIGSIGGVGLGLGGGFLLVSFAAFPMVYPTDWIVIAVVVGIGVGVVSGLYPAWRAARVDPIEALRRE